MGAWKTLPQGIEGGEVQGSGFRERAGHAFRQRGQDGCWLRCRLNFVGVNAKLSQALG
jgi:hypothetical protein